MQNIAYLKTGRLFFALAIICIGMVHLVGGHFPTGLLPVDKAVNDVRILCDICGCVLIAAGVILLTPKYVKYGIYLTGLFLLNFLFFIHLPRLVMNLQSGEAWTGTFEITSLLCGVLVIWGINRAESLLLAGNYLFAAGLFVFGVLHAVYGTYISVLIPAWIPFPVFWAYFVGAAFFAASISLFIQKQVHLAATLLAIMFFLWVCIEHAPRVIASPNMETEWTSLFVALAMCGISLMIAGSFKKLRFAMN